MSSRRDSQAAGRGALWRFAAMLGILILAFVLFRTTGAWETLSLDRLSAALEEIRRAWWSPLALIGLWTTLAPLGMPATPLLLAGGVVFGPWLGTAYNVVGAVLGTATTYGFARGLGHEFVGYLFGPKRLESFARRVENQGFWALASLRLIPLPWQVLNFGAPLAGLQFGPYILSTIVGFPAQVFVFTFFYASLRHVAKDAGRQAAVWLFVALGLMALLAVVRLLLRRRATLDGRS